MGLVVWDIWEHLIDTINWGIRSECKRSNPCYCDSIIAFQSVPAGLCVVHHERTNADCQLPSSPTLLLQGPLDELQENTAYHVLHFKRSRSAESGGSP